MNACAIYVPRLNALPYVKDGSAIISTESAGPSMTIDYEGGMYHGTLSFADKVAIAHGRHSERYPTIARAVVADLDLIRVGTFDTTYGRVSVTDAPNLTLWLGHPLVEQDLLASGFRYESLRAVESWTPQQRQQIKMLPHKQRRMYQEAGLI